MNLLLGALPETDLDAKNAAKALLELSDKEVDLQVAACQSKFKSPLQGRVWKFALLPTAAMTEEVRSRISTLLHAKFEGLRFEVAREAQTELESKLWQRLQKSTLSRLGPFNKLGPFSFGASTLTFVIQIYIYIYIHICTRARARAQKQTLGKNQTEQHALGKIKSQNMHACGLKKTLVVVS